MWKRYQKKLGNLEISAIRKALLGLTLCCLGCRVTPFFVGIEGRFLRNEKAKKCRVPSTKGYPAENQKQ